MENKFRKITKKINKFYPIELTKEELNFVMQSQITILSNWEYSNLDLCDVDISSFSIENILKYQPLFEIMRLRKIRNDNSIYYILKAYYDTEYDSNIEKYFLLNI